MSRIGTKKPPIKNAYYAPQEHVPGMNAKGKSAYAKAVFSNASNWEKIDFNSSNKDKAK